MFDISGFYWTDVYFFSSENLGEFRIRGLQIGLYLRNISNENLGDHAHVLCCLINLGDHKKSQGNASRVNNSFLICDVGVFFQLSFFFN